MRKAVKQEVHLNIYIFASFMKVEFELLEIYQELLNVFQYLQKIEIIAQ